MLKYEFKHLKRTHLQTWLNGQDQSGGLDVEVEAPAVVPDRPEEVRPHVVVEDLRHEALALEVGLEDHPELTLRVVLSTLDVELLRGRIWKYYRGHPAGVPLLEGVGVTRHVHVGLLLQDVGHPPQQIGRVIPGDRMRS